MRLAVAAGLAGQLFALGYGIWFASKKKKPIHIEFHDLGIRISKLGIQNLLDTEIARELEISYSTERNWEGLLEISGELNTLEGTNFVNRYIEKLEKAPRSPAKRFFGWVLRLLLTAVKFGSEELPELHITKKRLSRAKAGSVLVGYCSDLVVVEESWKILSEVVERSGRPDFTRDAGSNESVSIHWRLGDMLGSDFHGVVAWSSIFDCIVASGCSRLPIRIFTNSPKLVLKVLSNTNHGLNIEVFSGDIWEDLFAMTRSRIFIGTNSQVSLLAAMSLDNSRHETSIFIPKPFHLTPKWRRFYHPPPKAERNFIYYNARFVTRLT